MSDTNMAKPVMADMNAQIATMLDDMNTSEKLRTFYEIAKFICTDFRSEIPEDVLDNDQDLYTFIENTANIVNDIQDIYE